MTLAREMPGPPLTQNARLPLTRRGMARWARWHDGDARTRADLESGLHSDEVRGLYVFLRNRDACGDPDDWVTVPSNSQKVLRANPVIVTRLLRNLDVRKDAYPDFLRSLRLMDGNGPLGAEQAMDEALRRALEPGWDAKEEAPPPEPDGRHAAPRFAEDEKLTEPRTRFILPKVEERIEEWLQRHPEIDAEQGWSGAVIAQIAADLAVNPVSIERRIDQLKGWARDRRQGVETAPVPQGYRVVSPRKEREMSQEPTTRDRVAAILEERKVDLAQTVPMELQREIAKLVERTAGCVSGCISQLREARGIEIGRKWASPNGKRPEPLNSGVTTTMTELTGHQATPTLANGTNEVEEETPAEALVACVVAATSDHSPSAWETQGEQLRQALALAAQFEKDAKAAAASVAERDKVNKRLNGHLEDARGELDALQTTHAAAVQQIEGVVQFLDTFSATKPGGALGLGERLRLLVEHLQGEKVEATIVPVQAPAEVTPVREERGLAMGFDFSIGLDTPLTDDEKDEAARFVYIELGCEQAVALPYARRAAILGLAADMAALAASR